jgi:hypothetical protein
MQSFLNRTTAGSLRLNTARGTALLALFTIGVLLTGVGGAIAAPTGVPLKAAGSFAVLAGSGVTNAGTTTVNGDLGTYPTTSIADNGVLIVTGTNHGGDDVTAQAKTDLINAYDVAAGEGPTSPISADLGGQELVSGVYNSASTLLLTGTLTLNGAGNPQSVFVFQAGSSLTTGPSSRVRLINGAQACHVYWQVGSDAALDTGTRFVGTLIALTSITVATGATVDGRLLARDGDVTLDTNVISKPNCAEAPAAPTPTPETTAEAATTVAATTAATTTAPAATTTAAAPTTTAATTTAATVTTPAPPKKAKAVKPAKRAVKAKKSSGGSTSTGFAKPPQRRPAFTG